MMGATLMAGAEKTSYKKLPTSPVMRAFNDNESALKRFVERFLYNSQETEDILQEAFLQTWRIEKKIAITAPKAYLFRVCRNLALKTMKKKSHHIIEYIEEMAPDDLASNVGSVEDAVDVSNRLRVFEDALSSLSPQCKKAFLLRKVYGYSQKEIARRLKITVSTVEKHIAKGLQQCGAYMEKEGFDRLLASRLPSNPNPLAKQIKEAK